MRALLVTLGAVSLLTGAWWLARWRTYEWLVVGPAVGWAAAGALLLLFSAPDPRGPARRAGRWGCLWGATLGGLFLLGGVLVPVFSFPETPEMILLGFYVTGPVGFAVGAAGGALRHLLRR